MLDMPERCRADIAERLLYLDGSPFSLADYPFFIDIYNGEHRGLLLKTARQVAKSTTLCNFTICESIGIPHFRTLFVSPSQEQTQRFSNTRLAKVVHYSPLVRRHFITKDFTDRTMLRMFKNGSEVTLTYACDDPDRARGPSADRVNYDEVQDILYEPVVPVINECMSNSNYAYETYAGTPKTMENTIEHLWSLSTQNEWIIPCEGCGRWNFIDSVASIGKTGPVCLKCDKNLNPRLGRWYAFNPQQKMSDKESTELMKELNISKDDATKYVTQRLNGFHISQPMMPLNCESPVRWVRILEKLERYSETKFKNEVLGVSDSIGARLVSKDELESLCQDFAIYRAPPVNSLKDFSHIVGGVDWSGGGTEGYSRSTIWIFGVTKDHKLKTLYFRIYPVTNPVSVVDDIVEVFQAYNVNLVAGDRGEGHLANNIIAKRLGNHRVIQIQYGAQASPITFNEKGGYYQVDRTTLMDNYFMVLKRGGVVFPHLKYMTEPIKDILNIFEEVTNTGKKVWRHAPSQPDDAFHAQLFAWLAAKILLMDLEFTG